MQAGAAGAARVVWTATAAEAMAKSRYPGLAGACRERGVMVTVLTARGAATAKEELASATAAAVVVVMVKVVLMA